MLKTFPQFIIRKHLSKISKLEKYIGHKLEFPKIHRRWINGYAVFDLTKHWKKFGLDVVGIDYFTMGNLRKGISTRFDAKELEYQSWLGGYLVKLNKGKKFTIQDHFNLAVVDQIDWLKHFGDANPICELHPSGFQKLGEVEISGHKGILYVGGGISHTDVGQSSQTSWTRLLMAYMAAVINGSNSTLKTVSSNFIPKSTADSYKTVYLKGYIITLELDQNIHAVLYGNGAIFLDDNRKEVNTFEPLKEDLLSALKAIVITKL